MIETWQISFRKYHKRKVFLRYGFECGSSGDRCGWTSACRCGTGTASDLKTKDITILGVVHKWCHAILDYFGPPPPIVMNFYCKGFSTTVTKSLNLPPPLRQCDSFMDYLIRTLWKKQAISRCRPFKYLWMILKQPTTLHLPLRILWTDVAIRGSYFCSWTATRLKVTRKNLFVSFFRFGLNPRKTRYHSCSAISRYDQNIHNFISSGSDFT